MKHRIAKQTKSEEGVALKVEMAKRSWSWPELAEATGLAAATLRSQYSRNFPRKRIRLVVEHRGVGRPLWSSREAFKRREL